MRVAIAINEYELRKIVARHVATLFPTLPHLTVANFEVKAAHTSKAKWRQPADMRVVIEREVAP